MVPSRGVRYEHWNTTPQAPPRCFSLVSQLVVTKEPIRDSPPVCPYVLDLLSFEFRRLFIFIASPCHEKQLETPMRSLQTIPKFRFCCGLLYLVRFEDFYKIPVSGVIDVYLDYNLACYWPHGKE